MENIYIVKGALGEELCDFLGYDEMHYDEKISLDLVFDKILKILKEMSKK